MENTTLYIDPETRDLAFDESGNLKMISGKDTTVQNVRHALLTWIAEFFADETHGTDYPQIVGLNENDIDDSQIKEVVREAVFQEPDVARIDSLAISVEKRSITATFTATLANGETINLEVTA